MPIEAMWSIPASINYNLTDSGTGLLPVKPQAIIWTKVFVQWVTFNKWLKFILFD